MKQVAIHDANILIDLEVAALLDLWFQLDYQTIASDIVIAELDENHRDVIRYVDSGNIAVQRFNAEQMTEIYNMHNHRYPKLALADCFALLLARHKSTILLTGDKCLRNIAEEESVEVHSILWVFKMLIGEGILQPSIAAKKLEDLISSNRFLPQRDCTDYINRWKA